ncbi:MAG: hypothetical protein J5J00_06815 [Deltaproteobacteria bacterium]|nr:hypothetical protein [Deltaproteobacteria bacterium]
MFPPSEFALCYTQDQIHRRVIQLAGEVTRWSDCTSQHLLVLPVLTGALFFFADLVRAMPVPIEAVPIRARAYDTKNDQLSGAQVGIDVGDVTPYGRNVLVVDDICDTGRTLTTLKQALLKKGAREIKSAVLIRRTGGGAEFEPDWTGFEYPGKEWFVGYGMDTQGGWRNLPQIYTMNRGS